MGKVNQWHTPKLTVLLRGDSRQENVLELCKLEHELMGPIGYFGACSEAFDMPGGCGRCDEEPLS